MSAKHAVLGLLIERPGYGYDLSCRLRERFGSSGFAPTGVYSALDQLSAEGLVRPSGFSADGGERTAPRTIYEATEQGRERFERWMRSTSSLAHVRDELNMKMALSRPQDLPVLIELARTQQEQCLAQLDALRQADVQEQRSRPQGAALAWPRVAGLLVRDAEARQLQARIEWLQRAAAIMAKLTRTAPSQARARVEQPTGAGAAMRDDRPAAEARVA